MHPSTCLPEKHTPSQDWECWESGLPMHLAGTHLPGWLGLLRPGVWARPEPGKRLPCPPGVGLQPGSPGSRARARTSGPISPLSRCLMPLGPVLVSPCGRGKQCFLLEPFIESDRNPTQTDLTIKRTFTDSRGQKVQECLASDTAHQGLKPCKVADVHSCPPHWVSQEHWQHSGVRHSCHTWAASRGHVPVHLRALPMARHL